MQVSDWDIYDKERKHCWTKLSEQDMILTSFFKGHEPNFNCFICKVYYDIYFEQTLIVRTIAIAFHLFVKGS